MFWGEAQAGAPPLFRETLTCAEARTVAEKKTSFFAECVLKQERSVPSGQERRPCPWGRGGHVPAGTVPSCAAQHPGPPPFLVSADSPHLGTPDATPKPQRNTNPQALLIFLLIGKWPVHP